MKQFSLTLWILIWVTGLLLVPLACLVLAGVIFGIRNPSAWEFLLGLFPLAVIATTFTIAWRADMHDRNCAENNICPKCGYNRAGLDPSVVCPECGRK